MFLSYRYGKPPRDRHPRESVAGTRPSTGGPAGPPCASRAAEGPTGAAAANVMDVTETPVAPLMCCNGQTCTAEGPTGAAAASVRSQEAAQVLYILVCLRNSEYTAAAANVRAQEAAQGLAACLQAVPDEGPRSSSAG